MSAGKLHFTSISTAILLSIVALPASVMAFAIVYASDDPFWSVFWMGVVLPTIWVAVVVLSIIDTLQRRSWRQIVGALLLLAPTVLLLSLMLSPRFMLHQLFTYRAVNRPVNALAYFGKFSVCIQQAGCTSSGTVTETKTFRLTKVPDGCCFLRVINGRGEHKAENVHIVLNGEEISLPSDDSLPPASVRLRSENKLSVQLTGTTDAYIYVVIWDRNKNSM